MTTTTIKELSIHFTSIIMSFTLVGFSIYKLAKNESTDLYIALLTSVICVYIPSPLQLSNLIKSNNQNNTNNV